MNKPFYLDINIKSSLTQRTCGQILVEFIKYLLYQKLQIPFPYDRLKFVVNRKRCSEEYHKFESIASSKQFKLASFTLDNLDFVLKNLQHQMETPVPPEEVSIAFGTTTLSFKEVYRVVLPQYYHKSTCEQINLKNSHLQGLNVLRTIVTSSNLEPLLSNSLQPTCMFVSIKKPANDSNICDSIFNCWNGCRLPKKASLALINMKTTKESCKCCDNFNVFEDEVELLKLKSCTLNDSSDNELYEFKADSKNVWFQSSVVIKGFKDCLVNGSSVTDQWT